MKALAPVQARWAALAPREQSMLRLACTLVALALVWWLLLAPPIKALRASDARHAQVDTRWQQMQQWQAEAEQLKALPQHTAADAPQALREATEKHLGAAARITVAAGRATVTLTNAPAAALAAWLAQVRASTQAAPQEAHLTRANGDAPGVHWSGTLVLALPAP
ncbi:MAG: type II secretion system protein GspM [Comamonadaceae bacterium]|nr:type II secretion system protein M [Burkholderiales bacterium]MEB2347013.1 type II secretion system protein GspM [Comamonadaceae bacterium]